MMASRCGVCGALWTGGHSCVPGPFPGPSADPIFERVRKALADEDAQREIATLKARLDEAGWEVRRLSAKNSALKATLEALRSECLQIADRAPAVPRAVTARRLQTSVAERFIKAMDTATEPPPVASDDDGS